MGSSQGRVFLNVCGHISHVLEPKEHLGSLNKERPSQAGPVRGERREQRGVRGSMHEEINFPTLCDEAWPLNAPITKGEPVP